MAEYRRGQGPNALPQGAATALNRFQPDKAGYQDMDIPVEFAPGNEPDEPDEGDGGYSENMQVLLSAPDAGYRARLMPRESPTRVPRYVVRHLPTLMAAARMPDAPPTLRALFNAVVEYMDREGA